MKFKNILSKTLLITSYFMLQYCSIIIAATSPVILGYNQSKAAKQELDRTLSYLKEQGGCAQFFENDLVKGLSSKDFSLTETTCPTSTW